MKKFFLLFAILSCTVAATAGVPNLDGGVSSLGVETNEDLWDLLRGQYIAYYNLTDVDESKYSDVENAQKFFVDYHKENDHEILYKVVSGKSDWRWIAEYMKNGCGYGAEYTAGGIQNSPSDKWFSHIAAFLNCKSRSLDDSYRGEWVTYGLPTYWKTWYDMFWDIPTKSGCGFAGWKDSAGRLVATWELAQGQTLTAQWVEAGLVSLNADGGSLKTLSDAQTLYNALTSIATEVKGSNTVWKTISAMKTEIASSVDKKFTYSCPADNGTSGRTFPQSTGAFDETKKSSFMAKIKMHSSLKYVVDYVEYVRGIDDLVFYNRFDLMAFFLDDQYETAPVSMDYTTRGVSSEEWKRFYEFNSGPTKDNYTFEGWYTGQWGTGKKVTTWAEASKCAKLYACWKINTANNPTITFHTNGGNWGDLQMQEYPADADADADADAKSKIDAANLDNLWNAYKVAYKKYSGLAAGDQDREIAGGFSFGNVGELRNFLTTDTEKNGQKPWKWLGDYIISKSTTDPTSLKSNNVPVTKDISNDAWRTAIRYFFNPNTLPEDGKAWVSSTEHEQQNVTDKSGNQVSTTPGASLNLGANFTTAGKYANWNSMFTSWLGKNNAPVRLGYKFVGWSTQQDCSTGIVPLNKVTTGETLYAQWTPNLTWMDAIENATVHIGFITGETLEQSQIKDLNTAIPLIMTADVQNTDSVWLAYVVGGHSEITWSVVDAQTGEDCSGLILIETDADKFERNGEKADRKHYNIPFEDINEATGQDSKKYHYVVQFKRSSELAGGLVRIRAHCKNAYQDQTIEKEMWVPTRPSEPEHTVKYVYAYDLRAKFWPNPEKEKADEGQNDYEFYFKPNAEFVSGYLIIHAPDGDIMKEIKAEDYKGIGKETSVKVPELELMEDLKYDNYTEAKDEYQALGPDGLGLHWSIELTGPEVSTFGYTRKGEIPTDLARTGVLAVNTVPQSPTFGRTYAFVSYTDKDKMHTRGSYIFDAAMNAWENARQGTIPWSRMARMALDENGGVYFTDKGNTNPGIFHGVPNEFHPENMPISRFFPAALTDIVDDDEDENDKDEAARTEAQKEMLTAEGHWNYPIIMGNSKEIGSAFLAVDTYVRDGNLYLYGYAKGHSRRWANDDGPSKGAYEKLEDYTYNYREEDADAGKIPYHSIITYNLGPIASPATAWNSGMGMTITPLWSNHHAAHTANFQATKGGLWVCHDRAENMNSTWATSLMYLKWDDSAKKLNPGDGGMGAYNVGDKNNPVYKYVNGSVGAGFAYYERKTEGKPDMLVLQNATGQLLIFEVKYVNSIPDLTLKNVYEHKERHFNQMNFDYAGNLFCAGANGLSVFSIPEFVSKKEGEDITNTAVTPCPKRFAIKHDLYYDLVFTNKAGSKVDAAEEIKNSWHEPGNWSRDAVPGRNQIARIDHDVIITGDSAEVAALDLNAFEDGTYPTITIEPTGGLYYTAEVPVSKSTYARNASNAHIQLVKDQHPVPRDPLTSTEQVIVLSKNETKQHTCDDGSTVNKTVETRGVLQNMVTMPATIDFGTYGSFEDGPTLESDAYTEWDPFQHIAVPFPINAGDVFYCSIMYQWKEGKRDWDEFLSYYVPMYRFNGYLLTHDKVWEERTGLSIGNDSRHVMRGVLDPAVNRVGDGLKADEEKQQLTLNRTGNTPEDGYDFGWNYLGNSWTAPIYIANFKEEDFVDMQDYEVSEKVTTQAVVYLYDKGLQYKAYPINLVKSDEPGFTGKTIPALTSFYVYAGRADATLTLDYKTLTSKPEWLKSQAGAGTQGTSVAAMPVRRILPVKLNHEKMHISVTGDKGDFDELYLFEGAQYSDSFDQGYEALKLTSSDGAYLAAITELGDMSIVASPLIEGTLLNFAKQWSTTYTFSFEYNGTDHLSLEDGLTGTLTPITTGATYRFSASEDDSSRFRIVRKRESTDVATSVVNVWATEDNLYMNNPAGELIEVSVYAADGQLVMHKQTRESVTSLEVPMHGVYTIQVKTDDNVQTIKHIL